MESVRIADGLVVKLNTPKCDLKWKHCTGNPRVALRVHGCALIFVCEPCKSEMKCRVLTSYTISEECLCKRCNKPFSLANYIQEIDL